jgi:hypothetical protein
MPAVYVSYIQIYMFFDGCGIMCNGVEDDVNFSSFIELKRLRRFSCVFNQKSQ